MEAIRISSAPTGAWLGGIVPFGYRKTGAKATGSLILSEESIPRVDLSEADVLKMIYRLAAVERRPCYFIAISRLTGSDCLFSLDDRVDGVSGARRWGHFFAPTFSKCSPAPFSRFACSQNGPRRQGFASPRPTTARP